MTTPGTPVVQAGRPRGCVAAECATRPMRDSGGLGVLVAAGLAQAVVLLLLPIGVAWTAVGCAVVARGAAD